MKMKKLKLDRQHSLASSADITRLVGDLDASALSAILVLGPTLVEVEAAALWIPSEGEALPEPHQPPSTIARILDLVAPEDEDDRGDRR
jgi:hypothetical protein